MRRIDAQSRFGIDPGTIEQGHFIRSGYEPQRLDHVFAPKFLMGSRGYGEPVHLQRAVAVFDSGGSAMVDTLPQLQSVTSEGIIPQKAIIVFKQEVGIAHGRINNSPGFSHKELAPDREYVIGPAVVAREYLLRNTLGEDFNSIRVLPEAVGIWDKITAEHYPEQTLYNYYWLKQPIT